MNTDTVVRSKEWVKTSSSQTLQKKEKGRSIPSAVSVETYLQKINWNLKPLLQR